MYPTCPLFGAAAADDPRRRFTPVTTPCLLPHGSNTPGLLTGCRRKVGIGGRVQTTVSHTH
eukprot:6469270-Prymnesium_polylepis.1